MKLARELSLSCWMFVVTSGGTSWSGGCLGQQIECLRKICVSGTGCHERVGAGVCRDVCERQKLGDKSLKCLLFVPCLMPVLPESCSPVSVGSCNLKRFHTTSIYRTFITPHTQGPTTVQSTSQLPVECHWNQKPPPWCATEKGLE